MNKTLREAIIAGIAIAGITMIGIYPVLAIDWMQEVKSFDGKTFKDERGQDVPQILGEVVKNALLRDTMTTTTGHGPEPLEVKNKKFWLALKIHNDPKVDLTTDEIALARNAMQFLPTALYGQAVMMIDPTFKAPK